MKKTISVELTADEIKAAISYWLALTKNLIVEDVEFNVDGKDVDGDWHASLPLEYYLEGATLTVRDGEKTPARDPLLRGGPDDR